jgi:ADP-heptose:LPS heptosyltransferase
VPPLPSSLKAVLGRLLPPALHRRASGLWLLGRNLSRTARTLFREGSPEVLLYFGAAPGDDLLCTVVARELRARGLERIWMMSGHAPLFEGNPDIARVVPVDRWYSDYARALGRRYQLLRYAEHELERDRSVPTTRHIVAEMCAGAGVTGEVALRPRFFPTAAELAAAAWARGAIVIQTSGMAARHPMGNKEWFPERFQVVVDSLRSRFDFVQVGSEADPPLREARDLRGRTTHRQTAALLAGARLFVGLEGFVMHLARAVDCRSVIVFGGRTAPWQTGYSCNINLHTAPACSPCWLWNTCDHDRVCMRDIPASAVVEVIEAAMSGERGPLLEDTVVV